MAIIDAGDGELIVLLHGDPTPSFLWRSIISFSVAISPDFSQTSFRLV
jgi:haloalkane dehalogenase